MAIAIFPVILLVIGILLYFVSANGKVQEVGRIMFFCGLLVLTFVLSREVVRLVQLEPPAASFIV
jgi:Na+/phosphate symporter